MTLQQFREKAMDFNRRAEKAMRDGHIVADYGIVYDANSFNDPFQFNVEICRVEDYPIS